MENIPPLIYDDSSTIHLERIPGESLPIDRLYTEDEGVLIETPGLDVTGTIEFLFRIDGVEGFSELLGKPLCDPENESVICYQKCRKTPFFRYGDIRRIGVSRYAYTAARCIL